jgi:hypothetical protein
VIDIDDVIKEVSKNTGVDRDIVATICKHPFLQTVEVMKSEDDIRDILFNKLFQFKLKRRYKENKQSKYSSK